MAQASLTSVRARLKKLQGKIKRDPPLKPGPAGVGLLEMTPATMSAARGPADKARREAELRKAQEADLRAFRAMAEELDQVELTPTGRRALAARAPATPFSTLELSDDLDRVLVSFSVRRATWVLEKDFSYTTGPIGGQPRTITVLAGFEFDLASIPRVLWSALAPNELSLAAPLIHDYLYVLNTPPDGQSPAGSIAPPHTFTRKQADDLFYDMMIAAGVSKLRAEAAWTAVRLFGGYFWDN